MTPTYQVMIETAKRRTHGNGLAPTVVRVHKVFVTTKNREVAEQALKALDDTGNGYIRGAIRPAAAAPSTERQPKTRSDPR